MDYEQRLVEMWGEFMTESYTVGEYRAYLCSQVDLYPVDLEELMDRATQQAEAWGWGDPEVLGPDDLADLYLDQ